MGWLKDNVDALEKRGLISSNEELEIMKDFSDRAEAASLKRGISIPIRETIPILEDVLDVHGVLQTWREVRNTVTPFSLFFTLLGGAHDVFVGVREDSP